jgi:hypothetical protein
MALQVLDGPAATSALGAGPFPYTALGFTLVDGPYHVAAWIDGEPNNLYDIGEPRSAAYDFTISASNAVVGANVEITDDVDADGLLDYWEGQYFGDLDAVATGDDDKDGLTNKEEAGVYGLDPANWDSDGDGMDDKWELGYAPYLDPTDGLDGIEDADDDGLINLFEYQGVDGYGRLQQDPLEAPGVARINPYDTGDVLHPVNVDTDKDGLVDSFEAVWYDPAGGIDPTSAGDPGADPDGDGLSNYREQCLLASLGEGQSNDAWSGGPSSLPSAAGAEYNWFPATIWLGVPGATIAGSLVTYRYDAGNAWTDPTDGDGYGVVSIGHDTDGDLLPDGWEVEHNLDPKSGDSIASAGPPVVWNDDGYFGDPDNDGLLNFQEYNGQDGLRSSTKPFINGTGDETNPKEHNFRPLSTGAGPGISRPSISSTYWNQYESVTNGTLGSASPTAFIGASWGRDSDDDGYDDDVEIQQEYPPGTGKIGTSPVHSMSPYTRRSAKIVNKDGVPMPDPEGATVGYRPDVHSGNFSLECYVKIAAGSPLMNGSLIECFGPDLPGYEKSYSYILGLSNSIPYVGFHTLNTNQFYMVAGVALPQDRWIHLAAVWDTTRNTLALYIDGVVAQQKQRIYEESLSSYLFACKYAPCIGRSDDSSFVNNLMIDEVRIWSVARSPSEIDSYKSRFVSPSAAGLLAYFRFDDGGNSAEDFTRRAVKGLLGAEPRYYLYGDQGFALPVGNFTFDDTDYAPLSGASKWGADDSDGDGLPDDWELINLLDLNSAQGLNGASGDTDNDGLVNIYEYLSQTSPQSEDTDQNGILDGSEDLDGDGVPNIVEQTVGSRPDMKDTDDDGVTDSAEILGGSNPASSADPAVSRSIELDGGTGDYVDVPQSLAQALSSWTIEAWVNPSAVASGYVMRRTVQSLGGGVYAMNFCLGFDNTLLPYGGFVQLSGTPNFVTGARALPVDAWTHVAATYSVNSGILTLYTNGLVAGTALFGSVPVSGKGGDTFVRIGEDFAGMIDNVRLWGTVRSATQIGNSVKRTEDGVTTGMVHDFRFDDSQANEDDFSFDDYHQPRGAQDFIYPYDWSNQWTHAATLVGGARFVDQGAFPAPPSLRLLIDPEDARIAGAAWNCDGGDWLTSGQLVENLSTGRHTVVFRSVTGWTAPSSLVLYLSDGTAFTTNVSYNQQASLRINIEPAGVQTDATWTVDGGSDNAHAVTVSNLDAGVHTIEYGAVAGWCAPTNESLTLSPGEARQMTRQYTRPYISAIILPAEASEAGAVWKLDGGAWNVADAQLFAPEGVHTVSFQTVTGWTTPQKVVIRHTTTASTVVTGEYYVASALATVGSALGQVRQPRGLAVDLSVNQTLYVADSGNHRVLAYDLVNRTWTKFGAYGTAKPIGTKTYFNTPSGVALRGDGTLYVADMNNNRVQKRDPSTGRWSLLSTTKGTRVGQFVGPMGIAADSLGRVYVADHYNHRVQRHNGTSWQLLISPGTNTGKVYFPRGIMIDDADVLYVSDTGNAPSGQSRIQTFNTDGTYLETLGTRDSAEGGLARPGGMATSVDTLFVADIDHSRVAVRDMLTGEWTSLSGVATNVLRKPEYVAQQLRWLFVSDTANNAIRQIVIDYSAPVPFVLSSGATSTRVAWDALPGFRYTLQYSDDSWVTATDVPGATGLTGIDGLMNATHAAAPVAGREYRVVVVD